MPQIDVKITDLDPIPKLRNDDLFLVANPTMPVDGNPIINFPYTSNSISGGGLSSTIKETITNENTIICSEWDYDIKIKIDNPFFGDMVNNLCSEKNIEDEYGYKPSNQNLISSSSTINGDTIVNKDYVDQLTKMLYQNIISNLISGFTTIYGGNNILQSKPGSIIHSTKFEPATSYTENGITVSESASGRKDAKMRYYFGDGRTIANFGGFELKSPNTKWILHSGYFLRGANSSQPNNNDKSSTNFNGGGQDSKDYSVPLKKHTHSITNTDGGTSGKVSGSIDGSTNPVIFNGTKNENTANNHQGHNKGMSFGPHPITVTHTVSGSCSIDVSSFNSNIRANTTGDSDTPKITVNHIPVYKNVFIWERID